MFDNIKTIIKNPNLKLLLDTRVLGLLAFGVVAILVSWSGIKSIQTNYELQKQISVEQQKNYVQKLENENLKLSNEYYKTDQFLELAARRQFGKAAPGETIYIVPRSVALANITEVPKQVDQKASNSEDKPNYQKNLEAWFNFFLNKNGNNN